MNIQKKAFTLVELIVSVMIMTILASIWFYSYVWYLSEARDAERKASVWEIKSALKLYKQKRWAYPIPWNYFNITSSWNIVALQWKLDENVTLSTMENIPLDPYTKTTYSYSITKNKQETQIALTLENWEFPIALLEWYYKTVSKNVLPSIILATGATVSSDVEINWTSNRNLFILDWWNNLPYSVVKPYIPYYAWENIDNVLSSWNIDFWQNSDYRSCAEIEQAAKFIHTTWTEEYQIVNNFWILTNTWCLLP